MAKERSALKGKEPAGVKIEDLTGERTGRSVWKKEKTKMKWVRVNGTQVPCTDETELVACDTDGAEDDGWILEEPTIEAYGGAASSGTDDEHGEWVVLSAEKENDVTASNDTHGTEVQEKENLVKDKKGIKENDSDEEDDTWELKTILSHEAITNRNGFIKCGTDGCHLAACCLWASTASGEMLCYCCIDCQETEFRGWPALEDLPVTCLGSKHIRTMVAKSSIQKRPAMPKPATLTPSSKSGNDLQLSSSNKKGTCDMDGDEQAWC